MNDHVIDAAVYEIYSRCPWLIIVEKHIEMGIVIM